MAARAVVAVLQNVTRLAAWGLLLLLLGPVQLVHRYQEVVNQRVWTVLAQVIVVVVSVCGQRRGRFPKLSDGGV